MFTHQFEHGKWTVRDVTGTLAGSFATEAEATLFIGVLTQQRQQSPPVYKFAPSARPFVSVPRIPPGVLSQSAPVGPPRFAAPPPPASPGAPQPVPMPMPPTAPTAVPTSWLPPPPSSFTRPVPPPPPPAFASTPTPPPWARRHRGHIPRAPKPHRMPRPPRPSATTPWQRAGQHYARHAPAAFAAAGFGGVARAGLGAAAQAFPIAGPLAVGAVTVLGNVVRNLSEFGEKLNSANRYLTAYNGQIAAAYTRLAVGDFFRNVETANRTARTAEALTDSVNRMRQSWMSYDVFRGNAGNRFGEFNTRVMENFGNRLSPIFEGMNSLLAKIPKGTEEATANAVTDTVTMAVATLFAGPLGPILAWLLRLAGGGATPGGPLGPVDAWAADLARMGTGALIPLPPIGPMAPPPTL